MRIAFLTAPEGVEQVELTDPWQAAKSAGHDPVLVSTRSGEIQAFNHLDKADTFPVDEVVGETTATTSWSPAASPTISRRSAKRSWTCSPRRPPDGPGRWQAATAREVPRGRPRRRTAHPRPPVRR